MDTRILIEPVTQRRPGPKLKPRVALVCGECKQIFYTLRLNQKFCSNKCKFTNLSTLGHQAYSAKGNVTKFDVLCLSQCMPGIAHAKIAERVGISRERVRQILGNGGEHGFTKFCIKCSIGISTRKDGYWSQHKGLCRGCLNPQRRVDVFLVCQICGVTYTRTAAELRSLAKLGSASRFCSRSCASSNLGKTFGKYNLENYQKSYSTQYMSITCETCGKEYQIRESIIRRYKKLGFTRRFCSNACRKGFRKLPVEATL